MYIICIHIERERERYVHFVCVYVHACGSRRHTCAAVCFILDRPGSVFFDQELSSGRKHRYWISLWARVIDLKSLWNHIGGQAEEHPEAENSLPSPAILFYVAIIIFGKRNKSLISTTTTALHFLRQREITLRHLF